MAVPVIDSEVCTGCGVCESVCPEVFELGDDGVSHVIGGDLCEEEGCCEEAVASCPEEAITMAD